MIQLLPTSKSLILCFVIGLTSFVSGDVSGQDNGRLDSSEIKSLLAQAVRGVFRVDTKVGDGYGGGSATLLKVEQVGEKRIAYFATCFHVVHGAESISIFDSTTTRLDLENSISVFLRPDIDVALLRCELAVRPDGKNRKLLPVLEKGQLIRTDEDYKGEVLGIGFPFYRRSLLHESRLRFALAGPMQHFTSAGIYRGGGHRIRPAMGEPTARGMSGGLVTDSKGRFGGLIVGRLPDVVGFVIPGEVVNEVFLESQKRPAGFKSFDAALVQDWINSPYTEAAMQALQSTVSEFDDALGWSLHAPRADSPGE